MDSFDVILPAGGRIDDAFAQQAGTNVKALIEIEGETILARTIKALNATGLVGNTVVIGPAEVHDAAKGLSTFAIEEGTTGPENMYRGLDQLSKNNPNLGKVLLVTTDMPFLSAEILKRFIDSCPQGVDIGVPLVRQSEYEARFPDSGATFVPLRDNTWTTGGAFMIGAQAMHRIRPSIEKVFEQRKSKVGMAKLMGPAFALKYLLKTLTLADVEGKIKSLLGCSGKAITGAPAELAFDIDDLTDYEYAMKHLA